MAEQLAAAGARVAVVYRARADAAQEVVDGIVAAGGEACAFQADVRSSDAVGEMIRRVQSAWDTIDVLVNNAGITRDGLLARMSEADWHDVIETHLTGAFLCSKAVLRGMMRRRWGRIINVSSLAGLAGNAGQCNYAAAKAGLVGFTRALAKEVGSRKITVNAIAPGFVETDLTAGLAEAWKQEAIKRTPIGRFGQASEIASMVVYLASDAAAFITGQVISIDGGLGMR
jgi:3-oxoacyl-[acyl-carrier protein] reductase